MDLPASDVRYSHDRRASQREFEYLIRIDCIGFTYHYGFVIEHWRSQSTERKELRNVPRMFLNVVWASNLVDRLASSTFVTESIPIVLLLKQIWFLSQVKDSIFPVNSPDTVAFDILK